MAQTFYFKSPEHRERFVTAVQQLGRVFDGKVDPEYGAGLYILTADLSTWKAAQPYVSSRGMRIDDLMKEIDFSGGYMVLLQLAANLFNEHQASVNAVEIPERLDDANFQVALTAFMVRRRNWPLSSFAE